MHDQTRPMPRSRLGIVSFAALTAVALLSARAPAQQPGTWGRARDACNAAATRAGYVILRRDRESLTGGVYAAFRGTCAAAAIKSTSRVTSMGREGSSISQGSSDRAVRPAEWSRKTSGLSAAVRIS